MAMRGEPQVVLEKIQIHPCEKCPKAFTSVDDYSKHNDSCNNMHKNNIEVKEANLNLWKDVKEDLKSYVVLERVEIYQCAHCTRGFLNSRACRLHQLQHLHQNIITKRKLQRIKLQNTYVNGEYVKKYFCTECDEGFVMETTLKAHSIIHLPMPCICACGVGFYEQRDLISHKKLVHPHETVKRNWHFKLDDELSDTYKSDKSDENTSNNIIKNTKIGQVRPKLKAELRKKSIKSKVKKKTKGKKRSKGKNKLRSNKTSGNWIKKDNGMFDCIYCNTEIEECDISEHISEKHSKGPYKCNECDKIYHVKFLLAKHMYVHRGIQPFKCHICEKGFRQKSTMKLHVLRVHEGVKNYGCPHCEKAFFCKKNLEMHIHTHTGFKPYQCDLCNKFFSQPGTLKLHCDRVHNNIKRFECDFCGHKFFDKYAHELHLRTHTREKPLQCKFCMKPFGDPSALIRHERIHKQELKYSCEYCSKAYTDVSSLIGHKSRWHSRRQRKFKCDICRNGYFTKTDLKTHMQRAHGAWHKQFKCGTCGNKYFTNCDLRAHEVRCHNTRREKIMECDACGSKFFSKTDLKSHLKSVHA